jgi:ATP-dependent HslUV protease ATP-binding subunit HslU
VQRDLLPLVEGSTVSTKHGMVKTDHILFIASGAFHLAKPSDLIPELQGRLPIRVELAGAEHRRLRAHPDRAGRVADRSVQALLAPKASSWSSPRTASAHRRDRLQVNERTENIGARRLHTVMERLLEEASFSASDAGLSSSSTLRIDAAYVDSQLANLATDEDLSRFIL